MSANDLIRLVMMVLGLPVLLAFIWNAVIVQVEQRAKAKAIPKKN